MLNTTDIPAYSDTLGVILICLALWPRQKSHGEVLVIGGIEQNGSPTSKVMVVVLNPTLQDLAASTVARTICPRDPRLEPGQLASDLRREIEAFREGGEFELAFVLNLDRI